MSKLQWFWFRVHYDRIPPETVCATAYTMREAWDRLWRADHDRARYREHLPKRGWHKPLARILKIDVLKEPTIELAREPNFRAFLDECLRYTVR